MPKDYQNAKIYKIHCLTGGDVYYGSTTQPLSKRMSEHRKYYTGKAKSYSSLILFEKYGLDNCIIELVEEFPCDNVEQLRKREGYYHKNFDCVNKYIAGRTKEEYGEEYKDKKKEYDKELYKNNKDEIKKYQKEYYNNNKEEVLKQRKEYKKINKELIKEKNKKYREDNRELIRERDKKHRESKKKKESLNTSQTDSVNMV